MSVRRAKDTGITNRTGPSHTYEDPNPFYWQNDQTKGGKDTWIRNPSWPALPSVSNTEEKIVALAAIHSSTNSNFFALRCRGNYTVDWGDGNTINYTSDTKAEHQYYWDNTSLANTNVTLTDTGDLIVRTAHGYRDGNEVQFYQIANTTGIVQTQRYYTVNVSTNSFQISTEPNGTPVTLTTDGSASLLPYKMATVTVTPQAGANLTAIYLSAKHSQANLTSGIASSFLDMTISAPKAPILYFNYQYSDGEVYLRELESVRFVSLNTSLTSVQFSFCRNLQQVLFDCSTAGLTSTWYMFERCQNLRVAPFFDTSNVTTMTGMFSYCHALESLPVYDTRKVTTTQDMFWQCYSLREVPLWDFRAITTMFRMFYYCYRLRKVPYWNTVNVTNMSYMFQGCSSLYEVPQWDTTNVTTTQNMFQDCYSLLRTPQFNLANCTTVGGMFSGCTSLIEVPVLSLNKATDLGYMFQYCYALKKIGGLKNTNLVTSTSYMFYQATSLLYAPYFTTSNVTNFTFMFSSCPALESVPVYDMSKATTTYGMFYGCYGLKIAPTFDISNVTNITYMFYQCVELKTISLNNASNVSITTGAFDGCYSLSTVDVKGMKNTHSYVACSLSKEELEKIFTDLGTATSGATIQLSGPYYFSGSNWGISNTLNTTIATDKGWTVAF